MSDINFSYKISFQRPFSPAISAQDDYAIIRQFESDRGRIINSAAIRRLQQKNQVFPLERNAAVRSRLTHSLEVQQVGRHIVKEIFHRFKSNVRIGALGLSQMEAPYESMVEMTCLMHDVGNPPFGHFGVAVINDWFRRRLESPAWSRTLSVTIGARWPACACTPATKTTMRYAAAFVSICAILKATPRPSVWCIVCLSLI